MSEKRFPAWVPVTPVPTVRRRIRSGGTVKTFTMRAQTELDKRIFAGRAEIVLADLEECESVGWVEGTGPHLIARNVFAHGAGGLRLINPYM